MFVLIRIIKPRSSVGFLDLPGVFFNCQQLHSRFETQNKNGNPATDNGEENIID
jgi:hypothetical protein